MIDQIKKIQKLNTADKVQFILSTLLKTSLIFALVVAIIEKDWTTTFVSTIAIITILLPYYLVGKYELHFPVGFEFAIVIFIYATLFLGEVHGFYTRFWWWDVILHTGSGMAFGFIGFLVLYSFYRQGKFQAPPILLSFLSFSVAMTIGGLWEIFEFSMDSFFNLNMQKTGLVDTMWDLVVDAIGAFIASFSGYLYLTKKNIFGLGIFKYYLNSYFKRKIKKQ